jgi:hypothetical protein
MERGARGACMYVEKRGWVRYTTIWTRNDEDRNEIDDMRWGAHTIEISALARNFCTAFFLSSRTAGSIFPLPIVLVVELVELVAAAASEAGIAAIACRYDMGGDADDDADDDVADEAAVAIDDSRGVFVAVADDEQRELGMEGRKEEGNWRVGGQRWESRGPSHLIRVHAPD